MVAGEGIQEAQQVALGSGVNDLVDVGERKGILRAGLVEVGEVDTHALLPSFLGDDDGVGQPLWVPQLSDDPSGLQLTGFLDNEGLLLGGLLASLLLY